MKLKTLVKKCNAEYGDIEIEMLCHEADKAENGSLFFCLAGSKSDGHDFAAKAAERGASAVVCERMTANCGAEHAGCFRGGRFDVLRQSVERAENVRHYGN